MAIPVNELRKFEKDVQQCMKCGFCAYFCPVYKQEKVEKALSRGKVQLVKGVLEGRQEFTDGMLDVLDKCLLCKTCVVNCPAKARVDRAVLAARADAVAARGLPLSKRLVFSLLLPHRWWFGMALRWASWFQWILPGKGNVRHLPEFLTALGAGRHVPRIASRFLKKRVPEVVSPPAGVPVKAKAAFFSGCAMEFVFPDRAEDIVRQLAANGVEVHYSRSQGCCGAPVYMSGDFVLGHKMALKNVEALEHFDFVVTGCATCSSGLKEYAQYLAKDEAEKKRFEAFAAKIRNYAEFLVDDLKVPAKRLKAKPEFRGRKVTYHDPCHLCRHQGIRAQPRDLLKGIEGIEVVEMPGADACCGLGGSFSIHFYELSQKIAAGKVASILASKADVVATACPGCIIQIRDALLRAGHDIPVVHIGEIAEPV
jgi:glycolate oxidase iron-sulfur subunit